MTSAAAMALDDGPHPFSSQVSPSEARAVRLFGSVISTSFPFSTALQATTGPSELTFGLSAQPVLAATSSPSTLVYTSPYRNREGESLARLYRLEDCEIFRFPYAGDFRMGAERIDGHLPESRLDLAELRFLGPVLSYWFERRGLPTIHASAVERNGRGVAVVSCHGGGKSGLAAAMVLAGTSLLTDDLLVMEELDGHWEARPSYPEMRMWPDEAAHFVDSPESLPLVQSDSEKRRVAVGGGGFGSFHEASVPLAAIYLASRRPEGDGGVEIRPVPRSEALIELIRHSFSPRLVEAAGLQPDRLDRLSRLVRQVPVRRLSYPSGFERLPEVAEALLGSC